MKNKQFEIEATDRLMQVKYEIEKRNISYVKSVDVFHSMGRGFFYVEVIIEVNLLGFKKQETITGYLSKTNIYQISNEMFMDNILSDIRKRYKAIINSEQYQTYLDRLNEESEENKKDNGGYYGR